MRNIVLIGMPGCGKSTVGAELAKRYSMRLIDGDRLIEHEMHMKLAQIQRTLGQDAFRDIENRVLSSLQCHDSVIAPGGSCIYGQDAMRHLKSIGTILYLEASLDTIAKRIRNFNTRGITLREGQTLKDLYDERVPLYMQYADMLIHTDNKTLFEVVHEATKQLAKREKRRS